MPPALKHHQYSALCAASTIMEDLINFDIIETHKENIQSLPGGRSAKSLASTFAPTSTRPKGPTPGDTRNLNDAIREEYELELMSISDSDDPLDIYDRYVKWTFSAYPSAQGGPESQLRPLLERATKAFQSTPHYKNDPRYLKLWLKYIRFFSEAPRETFAYLARHNIGESLALFYEEFAAWLESAGRWNQADEVYKLGIEREARPVERLLRKFGEFQQRFETRVQTGEEPSSPALPTVRPALVAKIDPFAASTPRSVDPQAPRPSSGVGGSSVSRGGRNKLAIFSDADAPSSKSASALGDSSKGWDNIGTAAERKKENVMEARPWVGETLKAGKKTVGAPKMAVFKDESISQVTKANEIRSPRYADQQQTVNAKTGKIERVFVNLEVVYPDDGNEEMSFEELRAKSRGWLDRDWASKSRQKQRSPQNAQKEPVVEPTEVDPIPFESQSTQDTQSGPDLHDSPNSTLENTISVDLTREGRSGKPKKTKIREVKGATQTIKTNLESPTGPKLKRKNSAEPTMTLHTKAATEDILDIFNQPLRNVDPMSGPAESAGESDYDDDDYTSAGESTGTGRISGTSEFGDTEADIQTAANSEDTNAAASSVSPWSDFTASKHVPQYDGAEEDENATKETDEDGFLVLQDSQHKSKEGDDDFGVNTPISPQRENQNTRPRYVPIPPEDYEAPTGPYRDPSQASQNRLPFMTPIVEKTESSMGAITIREEKDYFNSKTPSRHKSNGHATPQIDEELISSPLQEIVNEASPPRVSKMKIKKPKANTKETSTAIIKDAQCNPVDESIRKTILDAIDPPLSSYPGYHDYRPLTSNRAPEIRKYIKALSKPKSASDKTSNSLSMPPSLRFPKHPSKTYTIKRELGKGAFAPVYLASEEDAISDSPEHLIAIKCEDPPTPWEFHIMTLLQSRLADHHHPSSSITSSLLRPHSLHLYSDEAYLLETYLDQGTLLDLVNLAKNDPSSTTAGAASTTGTLDESIAMFFTVELLRTVEAMHSVGILHGDLKADNCLVRLSPTPSSTDWDSQYHPDGSAGWSSKGLCLIDFGRSIDMRAFRPDVAFMADWKTGKQDCVEMRELRPWTYQADYFGVAGVVHSLLFGKYIEDVAVDAAPTVKDHPSSDVVDNRTIGLASKKKYKLREGLKRYWQTELWGALFEILLNPTANVEGEVGGKMPCVKGLRGVREGMEGWLGGEGGRRNGGLRNGLRRIEERVRERRGR
ncbi:protein kinase [Lecanora helva]